MKKLTKADKKIILYLPSVMSFMLLILAPATIFFNNIDELGYDIYNVLQAMVPISIMAFLGLSFLLIIARLINEKTFLILSCFFLVMFLFLFIEGTFLIKDLPLLDGAIWSMSDHKKMVGIEVLIFVFAFLGAFYSFFKLRKLEWEKAVGSICTIFLAFFIFSFFLTGISTKGFRDKKDIACSDACIFDMSDDSNFVILLLDMLDADLFSKQMELNPDYKEIFCDFTYYDNVVCGYPMTMRAVPFLLSGDWHENDEPFEEYCSNIFTNAKIFKEFERRGYRMGFYDPNFLNYYSTANCFENVKTAEKLAHPLDFIKMQIKLVGFQYLPYCLKQYCVLTSENIFWDSAVELNDNANYYLYSNEFIYDELKKVSVEKSNKNCFRFIYAYGAHEPFITDKDINRIENGTYEDAIASSMTIARTYIEKLKQAEVYNNSVVIILADHGYNGNEMLGRQNPVLFIKGIDEHHEMKTSSIPISHEDLPEAFIKLLDGKTGEQIFNIDSLNNRLCRRFLCYYGDGNAELTEYMQYGDASNDETLIATGTIYPPFSNYR